MYHNLGNLELAAGDVHESLKYYERAKAIYTKVGDAAVDKIAVTHLCVGRVQMNMGKLDEALKTTNVSEGLFKRSGSGADKGYMEKYEIFDV